MNSGPAHQSFTTDFYFQLIDSLKIPLFIIDSETLRFISANREALKLAGYTPTEIELHPFTEVFKLTGKNSIFSEKLPVNTTVKIKRKNGECIPSTVEVQSIKLSKTQIYLITVLQSENPNQSSNNQSGENYNLNQSIADNLRDIVFRFLPDTTLTFVNKAYCGNFNLNRNEILGRPFLDFVQEGEHSRIKSHIEHVIKNKIPVQYEYLEKLPDGSEIWWEWHDVPIFDRDGQVKEIQTTGRLITERKKSEENLRKSEKEITAFLKSVPDLVFWVDNKGQYLKVQANDQNLLLVPAEELIGKNINELLPEQEAQKSLEMLRKAFSTGEMVTYQYSLDLPNGRRYFENKIIPLSDVEACSMIRDITEKCHTDLSLKWNNTLLGAISGNSPWAYYVVDNRDERILYYNQRFVDIWNLSEKQSLLIEGKLNNKDIINLCVELIREPEKYKYSCLKLRSLEYEGLSDELMILKDGRIIRRYSAPLKDDAGNNLGRLYTFEDSTAEVKSREALAESELRWKFAIEGNGDGLWDWDVANSEVFFSDNWFIMLGYTPGELENNLKTWAERVHPDDMAMVSSEIEKYFNGLTEIYETEHRVKCKNGEYKWVLDRGIAVERTPEGKPRRLIGTHHDITLRKVHEAEIKEKNLKLDSNNRLLQDIFDMIPLRLFWKDKEGKYLGCNQLLAADAGLDNKEQIIGLNDSQLAWQVNAEKYRADDLEVMQTGIPKLNYEEPQANEKGQLLWLRTSKIPMYNETGEIAGIFGAYDDITKEKESEENLRKNEQFLSELLKLSNHLLTLNDQKDLLNHMGQSIPAMFNAQHCYITAWDENEKRTIPLSGYNETDVADTPADEIKEKTLTSSLLEYADVIAVEDVTNSEWLSPKIAAHYPEKSLLGLPIATGGVRYGALLVGYHQPHKFNSSEISHARLAKDIFSLIIARSNYQNDLDKSEKLMRSFIENAPVGILAANSQGKYVIGNQASADFFGYKLDELLNLGISDVLHPDSAEEGWNHFQQLMAKGTSITDAKLIKKDGTVFWSTVHGVKLSDDLLLSFHFDITDKINAREALSAEKNLLRTLLDSIPEMVFYKDTRHRYVGINKEFSRITGYSAEEVTGKTDAEIFGDKDAEFYILEDEKVMKTLIPRKIEDTVVDSHGNRLMTETLKAPYFDHEGNLKGILGVSRDNTERFRFQEMLKSKEAWMRGLLSSMKDLIFVIDRDGIFIEFYNSWNNTGLFTTPQNFLGKNFTEILPESLTLKLTNALEGIKSGEIMRSFSYSIPVNGDTFWFQAIISPILIDGENIDSYIAVTRDVTAETLATMQLDAERKLFLEGPTVIFKWKVTENWPVEYASPNVAELLGYSPEELTNSEFRYGDLLHPDDKEKISDEVRYNLNFKNNYFSQEYRLKRKDGHYIVIADHSTVYRNSSGEAVSILGYLQDITNSKELENSLVYRAALQQILMTTAAGFINAPFEELDTAIDNALAEVGRFVGADRAYLFEYDFINRIAKNTHEWCNTGIEPEIENLQDTPMDAFEDWLKVHQAGKTMLINDITELPEKGVREILEPQGIKSLIAVPMYHHDKLLGFIGFDAVHELKYWSDTERELLRFMAELFTNARVRVQYEEKIKQSEERFKSIYENTTIGLYRTTPEGKILMVNPALVKMLGYESEEEVLKINLSKSGVFESEREKFINEINKAGLIFGFETTWSKKDGSRIFVRESSRAFYNNEGKIEFFIGSVEDVTQRHLAENALLESEEKFRQLAENVDSIFWIVDNLSKEVLYINPAYSRIFGKAEATLLRNFTFILHHAYPNDKADLIRSFKAYTKGDELDTEARFLSKEKEIRWFRLRSFAIRNEYGDIIRHAGIATDITTMKKAEQSLIESLETEKRLGMLKSRFVSMTSHEFRTPLATIMASAETLQTYRNRMTDEQINQRIEKIINQVQHMKILMEDMLDLSRLESDKNVFNPRPANLKDLINEILTEFNAYSPGHKAVVFECDEEIPAFSFDQRVMRQVITNLVSNAIKYSPDQKTAKVTLKKVAENIVISVADKGIGIPENDIANLFEPFFRAGNVEKIPGTGLGMAIVKQGVALHNGRIEVNSVMNEGTTINCIFELNQI
jgi:PAS domain S-box-containing protein